LTLRPRHPPLQLTETTNGCILCDHV